MFEQVTSLLQPLAGDLVKYTLDLAIEIAREGREGRRMEPSSRSERTRRYWNIPGR